MNQNDVNLSFCGCGFLGIYHVGVASCFHQYAPQLSMHKISGSSAGALVAVAHICGNLQLAYCTTDILTVAIEARSHTLGPFHPSFDIQATVREALERGLPEDAYQKANGKLHVSLTRVEDGENVIISEFTSNEDLIQVLLCSCFIPFWSGLKLPKYKGVAYIDGGFSNNLLILDDKTVTVSPFAGEADICPQDDTLNLLQISLSNTSFSLSPNNLYRLSHALLPPEPEVLSELCEQGFADGIRYLQRVKLISCTKCLEIRSSLLVTTGGEDMEEVISMSQSTGNITGEQSDDNSNISNDTSAIHHIVLEQQEQKMIEINGSRRRDSIVSTTSHNYEQQHQQQDNNNNITPSISLQTLLNGIDLHGEDENSCDECVLIRQRALYDPLPKQFSDRIRDACDTVNKSLYNWIYSHRPVKYLAYLMAPYYLPIDITLALIYKCWKRLPIIRSELADCMYNLVDFLIGILKRMQTKSTSAILLGSGLSASWEEDAMTYEKELLKHHHETITTTHHYQHHRRHHHHSAVSTSSCATSTTATSNGAAREQHVHHHHVHHPPQQQQLSFPFKLTTSSSPSSLPPLSTSTSSQHNHQPRELHSLDDTFDSIVDVTSNQEARIFAYYFRDAKNRLQVTEIFDLERAAKKP